MHLKALRHVTIFNGEFLDDHGESLVFGKRRLARSSRRPGDRLLLCLGAQTGDQQCLPCARNDQ